jgi:hypothetical protein
MADIPSGQERHVEPLEAVAIDGAPIAYVVALTAVVAALGFVPFSVILGSGYSFPLSQAVYPLVGWILGPIAGAVAAGTGRLVGVFLAPHTAGVLPLASVWGAAVGGFAAGAMKRGKHRSGWSTWVSVLAVLEWTLFVGFAVRVNRVRWTVALLNTFVDWSAIALYGLPTQRVIRRWLGGPDVRRLTAGLFLGVWAVAGIAHLSVSAPMYLVLNWPEEIWLALIPVIPLEHLLRATTGALIGVGVIRGLRAIGLIKSREAAY